MTKVLRLGEFAEVGAGNSAPQNEGLFKGGTLPFVRTSDVGAIHIGSIESSRDLLTPEGANGLKLFPAGTILFPKSGASTFLNHRVILNIPTYVSSHLATIKANSEYALDCYIFYFLQTVDARDLCQDQAYPSLNRDQIAGIEVPLPSLEEQKKIVEKLDSAFSEIDLLEKNLNLGERKANELLKSILDYEYTSQDFKIETLENLVDILDNQRIPINATERLQRTGDVPYYGATGQVGTIDKSIFNETLILLGEDGVPFLDPAKHKAYEISGPSWVNNHAHVLRAKPDVIVQRYLLHFLNIFNYTGYVNGATRLKLTQGDMKQIPVSVPELDLQEKIVAKIDLVCEEINNINLKISLKREFANGLRQSILSSAFTQEEAVA